METIIKMYLQGKSYKEIAAAIDKPVTSIWDIVKRLRAEGKIPKKRKHLQKTGQRHNVAKLSDKQVLQLFEDYKLGLSNKEISEKFGIHVNYICQIIRGRSRTDNEVINNARKELLAYSKKKKSMPVKL